MPLIASRIASANSATSDFPLNNLPFGVISTAGSPPRCAVAIGDFALDLAALEADGRLDAGAPVFAADRLNPFMALGPAAWARVREQLTTLLAEGAETPIDDALVPLDAVTHHLPFAVSEYTDFYASKMHASNVGTMFRGPENALPPNWLHIPIGYNGRASSVVVSGTDIHRPLGQRKPPDAAAPTFGPSLRMDIELELGAVVGVASPWGAPITVEEADAMIFGYVLLNDWSSRDIQAWEYVPLGPFQGKAFGTTISPWVVTRAALEPFRAPLPPREVPELPYLHQAAPGLYDIHLEVAMEPPGADRETIISRTNYREMYYSSAQQLAHHAVGGCGMRVGDLLGSGTISGPTRGEHGSLLEISWGGKEPFALDTGETRSFIEDGDRLTLRGHCEGEGYRIGFGEATGRILPAVANRWA
ncbi:fumarylacetoacetase [Acuticoccus mangrovi]|uniref:fumarylacetoacetase n=1 Tax=Acuticoccus mangrovi TaxID=2796142 RepID=A0A934MER1_9HYPH|nr:fumarylacetoacetase [Acuticoccus mangrovi]MBJ3774160.1 fumarylacetoacetase [Acuticoccus mangrovi]